MKLNPQQIFISSFCGFPLFENIYFVFCCLSVYFSVETYNKLIIKLEFVH